MQKKTHLPINDKINIDEDFTEIIPIGASSQFGVKPGINQKSVVLHPQHHSFSILQNLVSVRKLSTIKKSFPVFLKLFV